MPMSVPAVTARHFGNERHYFPDSLLPPLPCSRAAKRRAVGRR